jgi:hypothetical protein
VAAEADRIARPSLSDDPDGFDVVLTTPFASVLDDL